MNFQQQSHGKINTVRVVFSAVSEKNIISSLRIHPQSPSFNPRNRPYAHAKALRPRGCFLISRIAGRSGEGIFFSMSLNHGGMFLTSEFPILQSVREWFYWSWCKINENPDGGVIITSLHAINAVYAVKYKIRRAAQLILKILRIAGLSRYIPDSLLLEDCRL